MIGCYQPVVIPILELALYYSSEIHTLIMIMILSLEYLVMLYVCMETSYPGFEKPEYTSWNTGFWSLIDKCTSSSFNLS